MGLLVHYSRSASEELGSALLQLDSEGLSPAHLALLLDVAADAAEARLHGAMSSDLVWTGPEAPGSHSRDTAVVVEELFSNAQRQVLVSSLVVRRGDVGFRPLAARMAEVRPSGYGCSSTFLEARTMRATTRNCVESSPTDSQNNGRGRSDRKSTTTPEPPRPIGQSRSWRLRTRAGRAACVNVLTGCPPASCFEGEMP